MTGHDRSQLVERIGVLAVAQNSLLVSRSRIPDAQTQHETVKLRFGQGVSAVVFNWVLGSENNERRKQGGLSLGSCAVNFISQHYVCEHRPWLPLKKTAVLLVDGKPDNV